MILDAFIDKEKILWIGTKKNGLFNLPIQNFSLYNWNNRSKLNHVSKQDAETHILTHDNSIVKAKFENGTPQFSELYQTNSKKLNCAFVEHEEQIYFGTDNGMYLYFSKTKTEYAFQELSNRKVTDIAQLPNGNLIIIANNKLFKYNEKYYKFVPFDGLENFSINSIQKLDDQLYLLGKENIYVLKHSGFSSIFNQTKQATEHNFVHLSNADSSRLWLSTTSSGLFQWNSKTKELIGFNESRKLPDTCIAHSVQIGDLLWIAAKNGIIQYDLVQNSYSFFGERYFDTPNFLPFVIKNGKSLFAVSNLGLHKYFDLKSEKKKVSNLSITQVMVKGIPIEMDTNFEIKSNDFPIEFNFQAISFKDKIYYQYALSGENEHWSKPTLSNSVSYNGLSEGQYTFRVRTYDPINETTLENLKITFIVKPPFWQTIMFVYLLLGVIGLVISIFYLVRIWRLKNQKRILQRLVDEKTYALTVQNQHIEQFSYSLSHDLKNPINNIKGLIEIMEEESGEEQTEIRKMLMNSALLLEDKIKTTLNTIKQIQANKKNVEQLNFEEIFELVKRSLLILIKENDVKFMIDFRTQSILYNPSILESIFYNMISNSIKYGQKNQQTVIRLSAYKENGQTHLIFEDNGIGFDTEKDLDKVFSIFERVNENDQTSGMGIGLYMIKQMIELNGGSLTVESEINVGTKFFVTLKPMEKETKDSE